LAAYILDTDHVSNFLRGNSVLLNRISTSSDLDIAITVITVQEVFNGWVGRINSPNQSKNLVKLYTNLWETTKFFRGAEILNFDEMANDCHIRLLETHKNLNKKNLSKDLRIAAIALSTDCTLVTRNYKDFSQIPNIKLENWIT
jgi:tRNA(fMet)-specific endonuclease VapC